MRIASDHQTSANRADRFILPKGKKRGVSESSQKTTFVLDTERMSAILDHLNLPPPRPSNDLLQIFSLTKSVLNNYCSRFAGHYPIQLSIVNVERIFLNIRVNRGCTRPDNRIRNNHASVGGDDHVIPSADSPTFKNLIQRQPSRSKTNSVGKVKIMGERFFP